jgi:hypothetical protein
MLFIIVFINSKKIEIIRIYNTGRIDKRGRHLYEAWSNEAPEKIITVAHFRKDGWRKLGAKVLKELE